MAKIITHLDWESRSTVDLRKAGLYVYAGDPSTDLLCASFAIDEGPVKLWFPGQDSREIRHALGHADEVHAFNSAFERLMLRDVAARRYGFKPLPIERFRCVMTAGLALGMPGSLENMAAALGIDERKDAVGRRIMLKMCKPRLPRKGEAPGLYWHEEPADLARLGAYCAQDTETERAVERRLLPLKQSELELWFLDQRCNDRGVFVDLDLANAAARVVASVTDRLNREMLKTSRGAVRGVTDMAGLLRFCKERGLPDTDSLAKDRLAELLAREDLDPAVRRCLEIRKEGGKSSVAKINALLNGRSEDGRARGLLRFHAASTGRWTGMRFQPQNLPRSQTKKGLIPDAVATVLEGRVDMLELCHGPALSVVSDTVRGMIRAAPGNILTAADLSNIEGRVLAWLAGEHWKVEAFKAFDEGRGPDLYKLAYSRSFGVPVGAVTDDMRQIGKVMELALGYQGGPGAFLVMAKGYGLKVGDHYDTIAKSAPAAVETAEASFDFRGHASGTSRRTWVAAETLKLLWREAHPAVVQFWADIERAAIMAVNGLMPGETIRDLADRPRTEYRPLVKCGRLKFKRAGSWLFMQLPSGRAMAYPYPAVMETPYFESTKQALTYKTVPDPLKPARIIPEPDGSISMKWARISTYGGMLCLAGDTLVLTDVGWRPLDRVTTDERVWDGGAWVRHGGLVAKGVREVVTLDGVCMTPDHQVLTVEGWKDASSCEGLDRAPVALPDRAPIFGVGWQEVALDRALRLRGREGDDGHGISEGARAVLRLPAEGAFERSAHDARDEQAPGLCGLAVHARPLPPADTSRMAQLRRARNFGVLGMGDVRKVLGGHGPDLSTGADDRARGQRGGVFGGELRLGDPEGAGAQQEDEYADRHAMGRDDGRRGVGAQRDRADDAALPAGARRVPVFDLLDAGHNHRFVVAGLTGPLIVHNCENAVQATARDILAHGMTALDAAGYGLILHVHDEPVSEDPIGFGSEAEYVRLMTTLPACYAGLPVSAGSFRANRYRK